MAEKTVGSQLLGAYKHVLSDSAALKIYSEPKPHNLKTAPIQKGLILLFKGSEVVGEGAGFGVPVLRYGDETYFSGNSSLWINENHGNVVICKEYFIDLVLKEQFRKLDVTGLALRRGLEVLNIIYRKNKQLANLTCKFKPVVGTFGVQSKFFQTTPKGKVTTTYTINTNKINIKLNFKHLDHGNLKQIVVLNEQAAHFFKKYFDSQGSVLFEGNIGVWDEVEASSAAVVHDQDQLGFSLKAIDGATLRRGREAVSGALDWIGLDYEVNPKKGGFEYEIEVLEKK